MRKESDSVKSDGVLSWLIMIAMCLVSIGVLYHYFGNDIIGFVQMFIGGG